MQVEAPRLRVSHTQIDCAANDETGCIRRWFFKYLHKLPEPVRDNLVFGTIAHSVVERWLGADDLGRDANGNPVELYPEGWAESLTHAEQDLVRRLVDAAIEKGVLRRTQGRKVELEFEFPLRKDEVDVVGKIDLAAPSEVTDHKFLKSLRYLMSPAKLENSGQHLLYVLALAYDLKKRKQVVPQEWTLGVNGFSKDPEDFRVKRVEVKVPLERAKQWQKEVLEPTVDKMLALRLAQPPIPVTSWRELPDPENKNAACGAYGGCSMAGICSGTETVKGYVNRVEKYNKKKQASLPAVQQVTGGDQKDMAGKSLFANLAKPKPTPTAVQAAAAAAAAAPEPEPIRTPEQARVEGDTNPPWAFADCTVKPCSGRGFNSKGSPCRICTGRAEKERGIKVSDYTIQVVDTGRIAWSANDGSTDGLVTLALDPAEQPKVKEVAPPPAIGDGEEAKRRFVEKEKEAIAEVLAEEPAPAENTNGEAPKGKGGRPKQGLTLYVNCTPTKGHRLKVTYLTDVLHQYGAKLAEELKVEGGYYLVNAFERRDFLSSRAASIAQDLGSCNLVCVRGPDEDRLIAALSAIEDVKVVEALR